MKILAVTHKYPPSIGGMQKQSYELINGLSREMVVESLIYSDKYPKLLFFLSIIPRIIFRFLKDRNISVIHANDGLMALIISPICFLLPVKMAVTIHGLDVVFPNYFYQLWVKHILSKYDCIVTVSHETKQECVKRGIPEDKTVCILNGFDPIVLKSDSGVASSKMETEKSNPILLAIGRPIKRKGFSWFAKNVLPYLKHDAELVIVGPREKHPKLIRFLDKCLPESLFNQLCLSIGLSLDEYELDKIINSNKLKGRIRFLGKLPQDELDALRQKAAMFVMPNIVVSGDYEGFGLVALEAVSTGLLCLASNADGIPSAIQDHQNGLMLESGDVNAWINTVNSLLDDPAQRENLAKQFQENLQSTSLSWQKMCDQYSHTLQALIKQ